MAGIEISITDIGGERIKRRLDRLSQMDTKSLLDDIGAVIESQVRRRIEEEKESPNGKAWEELSSRYEKWKKKRSSGGILQLDNHLLDSIQYEVRGDEIIVGSNLIYSWTHQKGRKLKKDDAEEPKKSKVKAAKKSKAEEAKIPARPYLGLSSSNRDEVKETITDWLRREFL
jgi:phage virion morphogenesis protein